MQYSRAGKSARWAQIDKLTFGFSQWCTLTAEVTLGKKDGFRSRRPDDYETLLDDAKSTHIILHDTTHKRAFQTNAEDLILHILLHRRSLSPSIADPFVDTKQVGDLRFASADRQVISTREVMLSNAENVFSFRRQFSTSELKESRFKDEVKLLYSTIDGLWAHSYAGGTKSVKLSLDFGQAVSGWEYMDVVRNSKWMLPKSIDLKKTCGRWNHYAKDIQAVVLFGGNFGDILKPAAPNAVCPTFTSLPRDVCYLAVRVDALESLFDRKGSLEDQKKLTDSGFTLQGSKDLFKPCDLGRHPNDQQCSSQRVVRLVNQSELGRSHSPMPLERDGAIIIGGIKNGLFPRVRRREDGDKPLPRSQRQERQASYRARQNTILTSHTHELEGSGLSSWGNSTYKPFKPMSSPEANPTPKSFLTSNYGDSLSSVASSGRWSGFSSINQASSSTSVPGVSSPPARTRSSAATFGISSGQRQNKILDLTMKQPMRLATQLQDHASKNDKLQIWEEAAVLECATSLLAISSQLPETDCALEPVRSQEKLATLPLEPLQSKLLPAEQQNYRERRLRRQPTFSQ